MPNQEEQLDFFVKTTWTKDDDDEDKAEPQKEKKPKTKEDEAAAEEELTKEEKDSGKPHIIFFYLLIIFLSYSIFRSEKTPLIIQMDDWNEVTYTRANYKTHALIKEGENKVFFMPSAANGIFNLIN